MILGAWKLQISVRKNGFQDLLPNFTGTPQMVAIVIYETEYNYVTVMSHTWLNVCTFSSGWGFNLKHL